jgi:site-specific DNA recombinase
MPPTHGALYARVSSAQQAAAQTLARQGAAVRERVTAAGLVWPAALPVLDAGDRGATWLRPARERLREGIAGGAVERVDGPSPERLARTYA